MNLSFFCFCFSPLPFLGTFLFVPPILFVDGKSGAGSWSFGIPLGAFSESFPYKLIPLKSSPTELNFSNVSENPMIYDSLKKKDSTWNTFLFPLYPYAVEKLASLSQEFPPHQMSSLIEIFIQAEAQMCEELWKHNAGPCECLINAYCFFILEVCFSANI